MELDPADWDALRNRAWTYDELAAEVQAACAAQPFTSNFSTVTVNGHNLSLEYRLVQFQCESPRSRETGPFPLDDVPIGIAYPVGPDRYFEFICLERRQL